MESTILTVSDKKLEAERERTGTGQSKVQRGGGNVPDGLSAAMITQWINSKFDTARQDHLDYVTRRWKALTDGE